MLALVNPFFNYEYSTGVASFTDDIIARVKQNHPSSHIFKIEKFSLLRKHRIHRCDSSVFQIGGYDWKLILYPNGNENDGGRFYISLYLAIESSLYGNSAVLVNMKLFAINQLERDSAIREGLWTFNAANSVRGAPRLIQVAPFFIDESQGFLVDDCCLFGVEIEVTLLAAKFLTRNIGTAECFKMIENPQNGKATWKITRFSSFVQSLHESHVFTVGPRKWKILISPKGHFEEEGKSISVYLKGYDFLGKNTPSATYAAYKLRILDQLYSNHVEKQTVCFHGANDVGNGFRNFMPLKDLHDTSNGYLVKDVLYVGVEFDLVSQTKYC